MPDFIYSAMNAEGKKREGRIEADSIGEATRILNDQGYLPLYIRRMEEDAKSFKKKARPVQSADSSESSSKGDDDDSSNGFNDILSGLCFGGGLAVILFFVESCSGKGSIIPPLLFWIIIPVFWLIYIACGGLKLKSFSKNLIGGTIAFIMTSMLMNPESAIRSLLHSISSSDNRKTTVASADKSSVSTPKKGKSELGNAKAQFELGLRYAKGEGVAQDMTEAVKLFHKAAEQGHAEAQCELGGCYVTGKGVARDMTEAAKWFRKAAEQGHARAQFFLGTCYAAGKGVAKDGTEAAKWFRKAAEWGHPLAQTRLGFCYRRGEGVAEDRTEAVKWFRKAAEWGEAEAQFSLGLCYATGAGVAEDLAEATKWIRKAARQGNLEAQVFLKGANVDW